MADKTLDDEPKAIPLEAIDYIKSKRLATSYNWSEIYAQEHASKFTVAKIMEMDVLDEIHQSVIDAVAEGQSFHSFKKGILVRLGENGWGNFEQEDEVTGEKITRLSNRRLRKVYAVNKTQSYHTGSWHRFEANKTTHPYLRYRLGPSKEHRLEHTRFNNLVLPVDDPFWRTHMPMNGWGCKCWVQSITADKAEKLGISKSPQLEMHDWVNKSTGRIHKVPKGIDPGFEYNVGKHRDKIMQQMLEDKILKTSKLSTQRAQRLQSVLDKHIDTDSNQMFKLHRTSWAPDFPDTIIDRKLGEATGHPLYAKAKAGDTTAAYQLAKDLVTDDAVSKLKKIIGNQEVTIVAVHAEEAVGRNKIPTATAVVLAKKLKATVSSNIVQAVKVSRTGADGWHRIAHPPAFDGRLPKGSVAILVDDTQTQGGTFASLRGHIKAHGSDVIGTYALTGKQYSVQLRLSKETWKELRNEYGNLEKWWKETFGYGMECLTEWEARYILKSGKSPDEVRDTIIERRSEASD